MIKYKLKEVKPRIFLMTFKDHYDLCMTFLRYQEFYESPNPKFRGKHFTIVDFMEWYSKKQSQGCFEYPKHWAGFNIPSYVIEKIHGIGRKFFVDMNQPKDYNKYDEIMFNVFNKCYETLDHRVEENPHKFYLIGAMEGNTDTINHEVAHGFFYTTPAYKKEMLSLVKNLKPSFRNKLYKSLEKIGYTKQVFADEAQAFLSTGWREFFPTLKGEDKEFIDVFQKYNKLIK